MTQNKKSKKLSKTGRMLVTGILVISLGVAGFSAYKLISGLWQYHIADEAYETFRDSFIVAEPLQQPQDTPEELEDYQKIDWDALHEVNPDVSMWIRLDDSSIDYPVVYASDNDWYLRHLIDGTFAYAGSIFVDCRNEQGFADKNTVLYGHHMTNDPLMFCEIEDYESQEFYESHKVIHIYTPEREYQVLPIAGVRSTGYVDYVQTTFSSDEEFMSYVNSFISESTFVSEETVTAEDRIVMFSTCAYYTENGRYVMIGKLVPVQTAAEKRAEEERLAEEARQAEEAAAAEAAAAEAAAAEEEASSEEEYSEEEYYEEEYVSEEE